MNFRLTLIGLALFVSVDVIMPLWNKKGMIIRMMIIAATINEADAVCAIDEYILGNDSRRGYLIEAIVSEKCLVAKTDDAIVGYITYDTTFYGNAFIWLVIVKQDFWRQGVATALIRHVEASCPTEKLFTSTNESNFAMQRLCERLGFVRSGWIDNLDEGDPEIVYFKRIR